MGVLRVFEGSSMEERSGSESEKCEEENCL